MYLSLEFRIRAACHQDTSPPCSLPAKHLTYRSLAGCRTIFNVQYLIMWCEINTTLLKQKKKGYFLASD
jgi:hypothetical protein